MERCSAMEDARLDTPAAIDTHLTKTLKAWERERYGVRFVFCDAKNRVRAHCPVDDLPAIARPDERRQAVSIFASALADDEVDGALLVVLTRPGSGAVCDSDRVWFHASHKACAQIGVRLLGVYLVTPADLREILLDDAL